MIQTVKASEIPAGTPEFVFGSPELTAFHYECGGTQECPGKCDMNNHGTQYIVNHGKGYRTLNTLDFYSVVPWSLDIVEGD